MSPREYIYSCASAILAACMVFGIYALLKKKKRRISFLLSLVLWIVLYGSWAAIGGLLCLFYPIENLFGGFESFEDAFKYQYGNAQIIAEIEGAGSRYIVTRNKDEITADILTQKDRHWYMPTSKLEMAGFENGYFFHIAYEPSSSMPDYYLVISYLEGNLYGDAYDPHYMQSIRIEGEIPAYITYREYHEGPLFCAMYLEDFEQGKPYVIEFLGKRTILEPAM